ncbi:MAG: hypothetical protein MZW92_46885 [Comamonadaceae bacterium]|nr:hypothetical protein [Comamonadaceae bacterium]
MARLISTMPAMTRMSSRNSRLTSPGTSRNGTNSARKASVDATTAGPMSAVAAVTSSLIGCSGVLRAAA